MCACLSLVLCCAVLCCVCVCVCITKAVFGEGGGGGMEEGGVLPNCHVNGGDGGSETTTGNGDAIDRRTEHVLPPLMSVSSPCCPNADGSEDDHEAGPSSSSLSSPSMRKPTTETPKLSKSPTRVRTKTTSSSASGGRRTRRSQSMTSMSMSASIGSTDMSDAGGRRKLLMSTSARRSSASSSRPTGGTVSSSTTKLPFVATFSPNTAGDFDITDRRIHPTLFEPNPVRLYSRETVARVRCSGLALEEAVAGNASTIRVRVELHAGAERPRAKGRERALSYLGVCFRMGPGQPQCSVTEVEPLVFDVSLCPPVSGAYALAVHFAGVAAEGSPFAMNVLKPMPQARTSYVDGKSLRDGVAGVEGRFILVACDQHGNVIRRTDAVNPFQIAVDGPADVESLVATGTRESGTYEVRYTCHSAGMYNVAIRVDGAHVRGSPFPLCVRPGGVCCAAKCTVVGSTEAIAGEEASFEIVAHDSFGNECVTGGETFHASLRPSISAPGLSPSSSSSSLTSSNASSTIGIHVADEKTGRYRCSYLPSVSGTFELNVMLVTRNKSLYYNPAIFGSSTSLIPCAGCVKQVIVHAGEAHAPSSVIHYGGERAKLYAAEDTDAHDGDFEGLVALATTATTQLDLVLRAKDKFGNFRVTGGNTCVAIEEDGPQGTECNNVAFTDNADGTYSLSLSEKKSGTYRLRIEMDGVPIRGSPFPLVVAPGDVDVSKCAADGSGLSSCFAGERASFLIASKDMYDNLLIAGGANFTICAYNEDTAGDDGDNNTRSENTELTTTSIPRQSPCDYVIHDQGDGTYEVEYFISSAGVYSMHVLGTGKVTAATPVPPLPLHIAGSPFATLVRPSHVTNAEQCRIVGDGAVRSVAGSEALFQIIAVDREGNASVKGGEVFSVRLNLDLDTVDKVSNGIRAVAVSAAANTIDAAVFDNSDGTYAVRYMLECAGEYTMTVTHTCGLVCKRRVRVSPAPAHAIGSSVVHYDDEYIAGNDARFLLLLADRHGNRIRHGGTNGSVHVRLVLADVRMSETQMNPSRRRPKTFDATVSDNHNGTCSISCVPVIEGAHDVVLVIGDVSLVKASIHVGASKICASQCVLEPLPGQTLTSTSTGGECEYRITSCDRFKNKLDLAVDGSERFSVYVRRTGASNINRDELENITVAQIDRVGTGEYRVRYTLIKTGEYELSATYSEDNGSTVHSFYRGDLVVVPGRVWPSRCVAVGYGLAAGTATAKETFYVKVKDRFGNPTNLDDDEDVLSLQIHEIQTHATATTYDDDELPDASRKRSANNTLSTGTSASMTFMWTCEQVGDEGTYRVSYTINDAGTYRLLVTVNGAPIDHSPFTVVVSAARKRDEIERYLESVRQFSGASGVMWDPDLEKSWRRDVMPSSALPPPIASREEWDDATALFLNVPSVDDDELQDAASSDNDTPGGRSPQRAKITPSVGGRSVHRLSFTEKEIVRVNSAARFTQRKRSTLLHMQLASIVDGIHRHSGAS